jgi:hypothetical protein
MQTVAVADAEHRLRLMAGCRPAVIAAEPQTDATAIRSRFGRRFQRREPGLGGVHSLQRQIKPYQAIYRDEPAGAKESTQSGKSSR